ncbi:OmpH family outer membrane protein [Salipiger marinus]|uniref:Periplasmic chaperone for outer membrane proteins Skp n=1 Tax=Salipiger marinus TaxID=555512 RepID=A0A1G8PSI6_9RHOB|nr:OmpH family outer membrane protein [Salipiger marinus]SDI95236.1 periplasmic chaperone for outer membrane proteins Skp [Salipiger marinus]
MAGRVRALLLALTCVLSAAAASAQDATRAGVVQSPILTLEVDRLYADSAYGRKVSAALEEQGADLAAENRRIESDLTEEERRLTEQRRSLPPAEFRALADAFDQKVQALRREQDAKARMLGDLSDNRRRQFLAEAEPVLAELMREAGAAVILDKRQVLLAAEVIDITETAISRIDAEIGEGPDLLPEPPLPDPAAPGTDP